MSDLHDHIHCIVTLRSITPRDVALALGVPLIQERETPHTEIYRGEPSGVFKEVTLKLARNRPAWLVAWDYAPAQMPHETDLDLSRYGRLVNIDIDPDIPPEGTKSLVYHYMDFKLFIGFTAKSGRLRSAALHKD